MSHILVAGLGDLGHGVAQHWLAQGHRVSAIRRQAHAPDGVDVYSQDLAADPVLLPPDQVDLLYIILSPGDRSVEAYQNTFLAAPQRLLDALAARQPLPPLVFVSSTAVYGDQTGVINEESPPRPNKFNGRILLAAEEEISTRTLTSVVRFSGIYGPGRHRLIRQVEAIAAGQPPPDPSWSNRIHRDDCVRLLGLLGQRWLDQEMVPPLVVGTDNTPSVNTGVLNWIGEQRGTPLQLDVPDIAPGKRIHSLFLEQDPELLAYADFRAGYSAVLQDYDQQTPD